MKIDKKKDNFMIINIVKIEKKHRLWHGALNCHGNCYYNI